MPTAVATVSLVARLLPPMDNIEDSLVLHWLLIACIHIQPLALHCIPFGHYSYDIIQRIAYWSNPQRFVNVIMEIGNVFRCVDYVNNKCGNVVARIFISCLITFQ